MPSMRRDVSLAERQEPDHLKNAVGPSPEVRIYEDFAQLPETYELLFAAGARLSFCLARPWFELLGRHILARGDRLRLVGLESPGARPQALALLVGRERPRDPELGGTRSLIGLANYYSMIYAPLLAADAAPEPALTVLLRALREQRPRIAALRFQPLDPASSAFPALQGALFEAGWAAQPYFHLTNWHEPTAGRNARDYLADRPSRLRNTLRRKMARLAAAGAEFELITGGRALEAGLKAYEAVYARSWKPAEPFPSVMRDLAGWAAREGTLRLGLLRIDDVPVAAQLWIVWHGWATLYKLVHDARFDRLSPGTVLTGRMLERLIDGDRATAIDLGVGDDAYKCDWAGERRELIGIVAFDPKTARGALGALRHVGGQRIKRWWP